MEQKGAETKINFKGRIIERGTRENLAGILVTINKEDLAYEANTNAQGVFEFYNLEPGTWQVEIKYENYILDAAATFSAVMNLRRPSFF